MGVSPRFPTCDRVTLPLGEGIALALTPYGVRKVKGCMDLKVLCKQNLCREVGGFPGFLVLQIGMCVCVRVKSLQSCLTLSDPMDSSPPGSSVHGILQARILEWVAMTSSRGSSQPRDRTLVSYILCIGRQVLYH